MMAIEVKACAYGGWKNAWSLSNGAVRAIVVASVGPRVLHFGPADGENQFFEATEDAGHTGGDEFRGYGGHRFWVAPELDDTPYPDNHPVEVQAFANGAAFISPLESSGFRKQVELRLHPSEPRLEVHHQLQYHGAKPRVAAPWALTVLRPGGRAILPLPPRAPWGKEHLLPTASFALWSYTDLSANCWIAGTKYVQFIQERVPGIGFGMQKLGMRNPAGWGAYLRDNRLFVKSVEWREARYPDFGCNYETFANERFLELETLGAEREMRSGDVVEHVERWGLWKVNVAAADDAGIDRVVLPRAKELQQAGPILRA